jgi:hypothetical protein
MSKYDKYRIQPQKTSSSNKYAKYRIMPTKQEGDGWGSLIGKSALKGLSSIADLPNLAAQGLEGLSRGQAEATRREFFPESEIETPEIDILSSNIPTSNTARKYIKEKTGLDLEPKPTTGGQRIASHAAEFAGSLSPWGLIGKGAGLAKAAKLAKTGTGIGAASGALQEGGANPLAADLASTVVAPYTAAKLNPKNLYSGFKKLPETAAKIPLRAMGLSPKDLNIEAATAARDLGIDLPAAALTDSTLTGLADQWLSKTPFFGNRLKKKYATTEDQTLKALDEIYNRTGPSKTPEIESKIADLYNEAVTTLPQEAKVKPTHLKKAIDNIKIDTAVLSPSEKDLLKTLETIKSEIEPQSKLVSQFGQIKIPIQDFDVNKLIGTKRSLNSIIKWDTDEGVKNYLRKIQKAISQDIAEYGKTNPEWYQSFKEADNLFGKVAKREKLEGLLSDKSINPAMDNLSYNALSKSINAPGKNELIKKQVDPETFEKIQKLGTVAKAMAVKSKNIPNPSGTAMTAATLGVVSGLITNPIATLSGSGIASVVGARIGSQLLTDKKFLDLALKLAENPGKPNLLTVTALNKRIKDLTGYSAVALNREFQRNQEEGVMEYGL